MKARQTTGLIPLACVLVGVVTLSAQQTPAPSPTFRTEVSIVEVSAVVTGEGDRPLIDLTRDDFEVLEDGVRRTVVAARFLSPAPAATPAPLPASLQGARLDEVVTNRDLADAPAFVLLLDDLNVSAYDSHRAIRAGLGVLGAIPRDALVSVVTTSGEGGGLLTLGRPNQGHAERVKAFRGRLVLAGPEQKNPLRIATTPSSVDAPCGVGSDVLNSPDCADPTRAARRARALQGVGELLSRTGSRRKVLVWVVTDMGVSPLDPHGNREAQFAGLQRLLAGDVTVYAVDPRENTGSFTAGGGGLGQGDRRTGGRMRVGPADSVFGGPGGSTMSLNTDDMVGVPLTQIARETGGRWIQNANNVEKLAAEIVTQNLSSYVLAYESAAGRVAGRHTIEVKVKRRGAKVSARRAFVVTPGDRAGASPPASADVATARLRDVIQGGVPFGTLALEAHVATQLAASGPARALVTVQVDQATASDASSLDVLVLAAQDDGKVVSVERFAMNRPTNGALWEGSITLSLERGSYQLRIAAATPDGTRTGLLLHPIDMRPPSGDLALGVPTLLGEDEAGVRPTLARTFAVGHPLAFQVEAAGDAVRTGTVTVHGRLVDAAGGEVRAQPATAEPGGSAAQLRATGLITTAGVAPGAYTLVVEARREGGGGAAATHAIPVRLEAAASGAGGTTATGTAETGAASGTASGVAVRVLTPLAVAHGPSTRHQRRGPQVIRTEQEWTTFWQSLPTRQAAPPIDFARVTLLAIVAEDGPPATPRITRVTTEPGGLVVEWTAEPMTAPAAAADPLRPVRRDGSHTGRRASPVRAGGVRTVGAVPRTALTRCAQRLPGPVHRRRLAVGRLVAADAAQRQVHAFRGPHRLHPPDRLVVVEVVADSGEVDQLQAVALDDLVLVRVPIHDGLDLAVRAQHLEQALGIHQFAVVGAERVMYEDHGRRG